MEGLDTMLSDAISVSALLSYDNKFHKFRQLKKQMSNISTPSPATSPEPPSSSSDLIALETIENDDVISQTVLKTINSIDEKDDDRPESRKWMKFDNLGSKAAAACPLRAPEYIKQNNI